MIDRCAAVGRVGARHGTLVLLVALVALHLRGWLAGGALFRRDINMVWLPQVESLVQCVAAGSWPLWDPFPSFGRPLLADPRAAVLYPPTWINFLVDPATAYGLLTAFHLVLAGFGAARLSRSWGASTLASATAGALWTTSGPLLSLTPMWHHLAGAAWMPWAILAVTRLLARPVRRHVVLAAAVLAAQLLAGSPDYSALTVLVLVLALPFWRPAPGQSRLPALGMLGAAAVLAVGLSAVQWWPTLEVALRSARRYQESAVAGTWSLHPELLPEVVVPLRWLDLPLTPESVRDLFDGKEPWLRSHYLGALAAVLFAAGAFTAHERRWWLLATTAAMVAWALGVHGPLGPILAVPGVQSLRYPVKALVPLALAWSLLSGSGVDALRAATRAARWGALAGALASGLILIMVLAALRAGLLDSVTRRLVAPAPELVTVPLAAALLVTAAAVLVAWGTQGRKAEVVAAILAASAVGDLTTHHLALNPTAPRALFGHRPDTLRLLDVREGARTYVYDYSMGPQGRKPSPWPYTIARVPVGWPVDAGLVLGVHEYLNPPTAARWKVFGSFDLDILDFDPVPLDVLNRWLRAHEEGPAHLRLLQIGAVRNVLALVPMSWWHDLEGAGSTPGFFSRPIQAFRVPDPLPRAYVVEGASVADGQAALDRLGDPGFDFRREVVLASGDSRHFAPQPAGAARVRERTCTTTTVDVDALRDGFLVMVDTHDPGWRAEVDGRREALLRANVAFQAVPVTRGRHRVHLVYRPRGLLAGALVSVLALIFAVWAAARDPARRPGGWSTRAC